MRGLRITELEELTELVGDELLVIVYNPDGTPVNRKIVVGNAFSLGPGTDNHVVRWDGTGSIQDSGVVIDDDNKMAVNVTGSTLGQVHIEQPDSDAALPVLVLDQADVDEAFVLCIGEAASGDLTRSIIDEGDQSTETLMGWVGIEVQDDGGQIDDMGYWIPFYSLA